MDLPKSESRDGELTLYELAYSVGNGTPFPAVPDWMNEIVMAQTLGWTLTELREQDALDVGRIAAFLPGFVAGQSELRARLARGTGS